MKQKILVLLSSSNKVPLREGGHHDTGIFLGELVEPLIPLLNGHYEIHFVSPDGKAATLDPNSYHLMYWSFSKSKREEGIHYLNQLISLGLEKPMNLKDLLQHKESLNVYDLLFIPGGHAPMTDLLHEDWMRSEEKNKDVGELLTYFKDLNKYTALICHAPAVLASAIDINGKSLYSGYKATCVTALSEFMTEDLPPFKSVQGHLKKYPGDYLKESGIQLSQKHIPMLSHVVVDRNLITGQDPYSATELGQVLSIKLKQLEVNLKY